MPDPKLPSTKQPLHHPSPGGDGAPPPSEWRSYALAAVAIVLLAMALNSLVSAPPRELSYTAFKQAVRADRVAEVTFDGDRIHGRFEPGAAPGEDTSAEPGDGGVGPRSSGGRVRGADHGDDTTAAATAANAARFTSTRPQMDDPELLQLLQRHDVEIRATSTQSGGLAQILIAFVPWLLILGIFLYVSWRMQQKLMGGSGGPQGGIFGFAKSGAKRFRTEDVKVRLDDVAGLRNAKADLAEIIGHLADPARFHALGAKIPKGVLLVGPPGTGKTLLARAVAGEAGVPFFSISGSEFVEMFVGVGAARVRDLFDAAKKTAPGVIFIDEIDAVGRSRGAGLGGGHDEREQTLNQILAEMDGFEPHEDVVVLAATNRPDVLDNALLRPGRFDRKIYLELPDKAARRAILDIHAKEIPLADDVALDQVAERTIGFSGADLANLVNEAALLAARRGQRTVDMALFVLARDKIVLGAEREQAIGTDERRLIAVHESGHALMAWLLPHADPLDKVTIIPRGQALGITEQVPREERHTYKQSYLRDRLGVMLGGRIAEQLVFGEVTTGAENDLEHATDLARKMVSRWGMSQAIGPLSFPRGHEHVFLGRDISEAPNFSDDTARRIDHEIKALVENVERDARALMREHQDALTGLAARLLEAETLDAADIDALLRDAGLSKPAAARDQGADAIPRAIRSANG
ncbi:ATP-dependent zinc metalloprotease FtsH [uncultured Thiohalocapsa sp.]|uniref:ATP-dependent zinc metalloprotease FtsH n=1 Tax=uncultured Thiohalocapsa sp. TaxID=768990 RepID=UPI003459F5D9